MYDEDDMPHQHNFSALNRIRISEPTENEIKKKEIMKQIHEYPHLFTGMEELMYKAYINGQTLEQAYEDQKHWLAFI